MRRNGRNQFHTTQVAPRPETGEIIGYARVSSREQALNSHALEQQIERLKGAGATLIVYEVQKGKKDNRPGLLYTMKLVQEKQASEVISTRLDRLGRSVPLIRRNISIFQETGVNLRVLDQFIDLKTSQGMFMVNILSSLAEMEVDQLSERVKHGKQHRRNQKAACECVPFAYHVEDNRYCLDHRLVLCLLEQRFDHYQELSVEEDLSKLPGITAAQIGRDCVEIFLETKGVSKATRVIVQKYGIGPCQSKTNGNDKIFHWRPMGLKRWLLNPVLQGHTAYNKRKQLASGKRQQLKPEEWEIHYNTHPDDRLITDEEAAEIREIIEFNAARVGVSLLNNDLSSPDTYTPYAYLRNLVFCAECQAKAITKSRESVDRQKKYFYYACRHARKGCNNLKGTPKELIEKTIINHLLQQSEALQGMGLNPELQELNLPPKSERLQKLEAQLAKLEEIPEADLEWEELKQKIRQQIQEELNPFSTKALETKTVQEIVQAGNNLVIWHLLSADEKVLIYPRLIDHITIRNGVVESVVLKT